MKKILITTLFLCSLFALNAQTGPIHPKEVDFFTEKKPTMKKYLIELDVEFKVLPCASFEIVDAYFDAMQNKYDFEYTIKSITYSIPKVVIYTFLSNDPRVFFQVGFFIATLDCMSKEVIELESNSN